MTDREKLEAATRKHLIAHGHDIGKESWGEIRYNRGEKQHHAKVGQLAPGVGEEIICILRDDTRKLYNICTQNRGVKRGNPIQVSQADIISANLL